MVEIRRQLTDTRNKTGGTNGKVGIAIHETANTSKGANAQAHANLQSRGNVRQASWHWQVDDKVAIQSLSHNVRAWHAGKANGNNNYIAIEICVNQDGNYVQACKNAAELVRHIRSQGVGRDLKQHNAFSGKDCPNFMREGRDGVTWDQFVRWVENGTDSSAPQPTRPAGDGRRRNVDGSLTLAIDGSLGPATIARWQEVMGTPIDGKISKPKSSLIVADQKFLNSVVDSGHIRNLTGSTKLSVDGDEGRKTILVRQFWLRNAISQGHQKNLIGKQLDFDGSFGPQSVKVLQFALNNATAGSGRYGGV